MIIFLGNIIDNSEYQWFNTNSLASIPFSSNTHQKSIISGLRYYEKTKVMYLAPCGFFPMRFKKAFINEYEVDSDTKRLKSCNIPIFRRMYNIRSQVRSLQEIIRNDDTLVCYTPFYQKIEVAYKIKQLFPKITIVVIVPDLIEHSYPKNKLKIIQVFYKWLRIIESKRLKKLLNFVDGFVYLTENMKEKVSNCKPYIIQEAIYDLQNDENLGENHKDNSNFIFTYCGKLSMFNGVDRLIEAFLHINDENARLFLCGNGELFDFAQQKSKYDSRIVVYGSISHNKVLEIEKQSTVLVNPRYTTFENIQYSFPSKLIEYMACGRPVISSHLSGIPSDYDSYLFYIKDNSMLELLNIMQYVHNLPIDKLNEIGEKNKKFVINNKSSFAQGKKLIDFIHYLKKYD